MTLRIKSLVVLSVCAALGAACKKKETAATGSGSDPGSAGSGSAVPVAVVDAAAPPAAADAAPTTAAADTTPELKAVEDTIAPILAMKDEDARDKAACKALDDITTKLRALDKSPPAGVDAAAWTAAVENMGGGLNDMAIECAEDSSPNLKALTDVMKAANDLRALIAKKGE